MKKIIFTIILSIVLLKIGSAQTINFAITSTTPQFQDADVGDMEFGDIDGDGDNDLIITGKGEPVRTTLYRNDGNGNFSEIIENVIEDVFASKVGLNDIDGDGDLDLLISGKNSSPVISSNLYINDGAGNFTLAVNTPFEALEEPDFEFGDIDNDGDDDLIMVGFNNSGNPSTKIYTNNGSGTFSALTSTNLEDIWGAIEFFDCDNDNDLDVILAGRNGNGDRFTGLYLNNGSGVFNLVVNTAFKDFDSGDIAIGDADNDGDLDVLLCGNIASNDIETELYLNDGTGSFSLLPNTTFADVALGEASFNDFDNDGDLDVFVLGTGEGGLFPVNTILGNVYENQGGNNFIFADSLIGGYLSSHAVADIDGDNDLDLVLGGTTIGSPTRATWMYTNETVISSTEQLVKSTVMEIYPNPSNGILNIKLEEQTDAMVNIYSQIGQLVYSNNIKTDFNQIQLDLPNGIYVLVVRTENSMASQKLIIQN